MPITIVVANDGMTAIARIVTVTGEEISRKTLVTAMRAAGIRKGVLTEEGIALVTDAAAAPEGTVLERVVAAGIPSTGEPARVEIVIQDTRIDIGTADARGVIDFRARGSFVFVEKGDVIARMVPFVPGDHGLTVLGHPLAPVAENKVTFPEGTGTRVVDGELRADRNGSLRFDGKRITVEDIIVVKGHLDFHTGNIETEGCVQIDGDVMPGFVLRAGKDVNIKGSVDAGEVHAAGNVVVKGGVLPQGRVSAKGELIVGFSNTGHLEAGTKLTVMREALYTTAFAGESIALKGGGAGGRVVGGVFRAGKTIDVNIAGDAAGSAERTELIVGVRGPAELERARLLSRIEEIRANKDRLKRIAAVAIPAQRQRISVLAEKETKEAIALEARILELTASTYDLSARIVIRKELCAGVRLQIGPATLYTTASSRGGIFMYDEESNSVIMKAGVRL